VDNEAANNQIIMILQMYAAQKSSNQIAHELNVSGILLGGRVVMRTLWGHIHGPKGRASYPADFLGPTE
jgi:hypothetical protein